MPSNDDCSYRKLSSNKRFSRMQEQVVCSSTSSSSSTTSVLSTTAAPSLHATTRSSSSSSSLPLPFACCCNIQNKQNNYNMKMCFMDFRRCRHRRRCMQCCAAPTADNTLMTHSNFLIKSSILFFVNIIFLINKRRVLTTANVFHNSSIVTFTVIVAVSLILNSCAVCSGHKVFVDANPSVFLGRDAPAKDFSKYSVVWPKLHHGKHKGPISHTREEKNDGVHIRNVILVFEHDGREFVADVVRNDDLLPTNHFLRSQISDSNGGGNKIETFTFDRLDHCHYQGKLRGIKRSHVAISTCNGISGMINDGNITLFIQPANRNGAMRTDQRQRPQPLDRHYVYSPQHYSTVQNGSCGHSLDDMRTIAESDLKRVKRASVSDSVIQGPYNSNKRSSYVELILVVDNKIFKSFNEDLREVHSHCKQIANIINALYVPLNIFIALVGIVVWNEKNAIEIDRDGDKTLTNFLNYRKTELQPHHPNDNAQLLTKEQFDGGVVGKALKGTFCTFQYSGGVSMDHSVIVAVVASTVAHEMGHNFGMEHDAPECKCEDARCIMSASSSSVPPLHWSSCSKDQLNLAFLHGLNYCLKNKPKKLFESPECGNGFVEAGEQCDCGLPQYCKNPCCDPVSCMLHKNASCATGECCDLETCRPRTAGIECRNSVGECDLPEYCTGGSEYCPANVFKRNTESCKDGEAYCYQGMCRSRSDQCRVLWGPSGISSDPCYTKNVNASRHGNCGMDRVNNRYVSCELPDIYCGMLHCRHFSEKLEYGMESVAVLSHSFMHHNGSVIACRTALVDLGLQTVDPGLVPDGAKCGVNKMCLAQKCVDIEKLRASGVGLPCPDNCNEHGVCNSNGNCHCESGFGSKYCNEPGPGGSFESGPASNPEDANIFNNITLMLFFGVFPTMALLAFAVYRCQQNRPLLYLRKATPKIPKQKPSKPGQHHGGLQSLSGLSLSTPSSPDDMNSALLRSSNSETESTILNNSMFGKFKGFTLKPLPNAAPATNMSGTNIAFVHPVTKAPPPPPAMGAAVQQQQQRTIPPPIVLSVVPARAAPPVPVTTKADKLAKTTMALTNSNNAVQKLVNASMAPALPPLNPGAHPRPIISSPILEGSTCTAKELISPLRVMTEKSGSQSALPLPMPPPLAPQSSTPSLPLATSSREGSVNELKEPNQKSSSGKALHKLTSFLRKDSASSSLSSSSSSPPRSTKPMLDKEKLRTIEISAPIVFSQDVAPPAVVTVEKRESRGLNRAQSVREGANSFASRTAVKTFSSMRDGSCENRPNSYVGSRPKSPPPPRPPAPSTAGPPQTYPDGPLPRLPLYASQTDNRLAHNDYDDCESVETADGGLHLYDISNADGIYAVIDETAPWRATESSLLEEIVNEIEHRNNESIYSASTLRKTSSSNEDDELGIDVGGRMAVDNSSTTSSGYLRPMAINPPVARIAPTTAAAVTVPTLKPKTTRTTFESTVEKPKLINPPPITQRPVAPGQAAGYKKPVVAKTKVVPLKPKPLPVAQKPVTITAMPATKRAAPVNVKSAGVRAATKPAKVTATAAATGAGVAASTTAAATVGGKQTKSNIAMLQQKFEAESKNANNVK